MTRARKILGRITFVGAGPGDPGLLATHACEALSAADVVIADPAIAAAVLALATVEVREPESTPAETAKVLGAEARNGHNVVRLIAGDPFADEGAVKEALAVSRTSVPFAVVPGVATGVGAAAYAGVAYGPVRTEADLTSLEATDFESLAAAPGTLVLTVAAMDVAEVGQQLVAYGVKPDSAVTVLF
jgi:uroporphyrinogen III methyltransferase/synthase